MLGDCTPVRIRRSGSSEARVWVLGALGRRSARRHFEARLLAVAAGDARPNATMLEPWVAILAGQECRVRDGRGSLGSLAVAARRCGLAVGRKSPRDMNRLTRRLRGIRPFLRPFRGVSLRWLQNYLEWKLMLGRHAFRLPVPFGERERGPPVSPGLRFLGLVL